MDDGSRVSPGNLGPHLNALLPDLEAIYKDLHAHPELSMQEVRTAGIAADRIRSAGYEATQGAGKTTPVMHACGHDMHVACLIGAATLMARAPVIHPTLETGVEAMVATARARLSQ